MSQYLLTFACVPHCKKLTDSDDPRHTPEVRDPLDRSMADPASGLISFAGLYEGPKQRVHRMTAQPEET